jgi:hypothetical protein
MVDTYAYKVIGQPMEIIAQNVIKKADNVTIIETCNNSDYDFKDSNNITYEVKADQKSLLTGNFFIACMHKGLYDTEFQPSGISKSKSDYHLITYGESLYKIKTHTLRHMIMLDYERRERRYLIKSYSNSRNETIKGILVKVEDIKAYARIYEFKR